MSNIKINRGALKAFKKIKRERKVITKILILTHTLYPEDIGGRQKYCYYLAKELVNSGNLVGIIYWRFQGLYDFNLSRSNFLKYPINYKLHKCSLIGMFTYLLMSILACLSKKYDIIVSNSMYFPLLTAFLLKILLGKPYIHTIHGPIEPRMLRGKGLRSIILKIAYSNAYAIITVSDEIEKLVKQIMGSNAKTYFITPGVDDKYFKIPVKPTHNDEVDAIIFTSRRLEYSKGIDVLIKAISFLVNDEKLRLLAYVVGDGSEAKRLKQLAKDLGVESNIHFTGFINEDLMLNLLKNADICVIPSRYEGTPIALFEYMAAAKPVLATKVGGIPAVLRNQDVLLEVNEPKMLATKLKLLIENDNLRVKLGISNRRIAKSNFSWEIISAKIQNLILSCLS